MELNPGYTQTELGLIPEDWEVKTLGEFISLRRGHDLTERDRKLGEVPVMGSAGQNGFHDTALAKAPGVVLGRSGASFGQAHLCAVDFWPHNTALFVTDFHGNNPWFVFYFLRSIDFSRYNSGGAQQSLNRNFIAPIPVAVPPTKAEQEAIAEALSDADALIESLEQLIGKKQQIKEGAMQELLTGKTRLPGATREWQLSRFEEFGDFSKGRGLPKDKLSGEGTLPAIPYTAIYTDFNEVIDHARIAQFTNSPRATMVIDGPHLLFASSSNMVENVGKVTAFVGGSDVAIGGDIILYKTVASVRFLSYLMSTRHQRRKTVALSQGSTIRHIYSSTLAKYEIALPSLDEQNAISAILGDIDAEIGAIEGKLAKARQIKEGMMQELLTGKTRLI